MNYYIEYGETTIDLNKCASGNYQVIFEFTNKRIIYPVAVVK